MRAGVLLEAIAFAARSHDGQLRRDHQTPYVSHPFRVCMILRQVFSVDDERMLAAAVLHDVIEDSSITKEDLAKHFGHEIAEWVALLSKDDQLEKNEREEQYRRQLKSACDEVKLIKLADVYDNLSDLSAEEDAFRSKKLVKAKSYLEVLRMSQNQAVLMAATIVASTYSLSP